MLIVNADDFGRSPGVNRGVVRAHEEGIVTSASLMVRWPAAVEAAAYCRKHPGLDLGIHLDLGEWCYVSGDWEPVYEVVDTDVEGAVTAEVDHQIALFQRLMGREPSHIDSHQHVHRREPVRAAAIAAARRIGVPLRDHDSRIMYSGAFYGQGGKGEPWPQGIALTGLLGLLAALPAGVTEVGCHPGEGEDFASTYLRERAEEVRVLCDPQVRRGLVANGIALASFRTLVSGIGSGAGEW